MTADQRHAFMRRIEKAVHSKYWRAICTVYVQETSVQVVVYHRESIRTLKKEVFELQFDMRLTADVLPEVETRILRAFGIQEAK